MNEKLRRMKLTLEALRVLHPEDEYLAGRLRGVEDAIKVVSDEQR